MKNFKYLYDAQSGEYKGLTREQPFVDNSTDIEPHFQPGFKTVFDVVNNGWKLVTRNSFYDQMSMIEKIKDYEGLLLKNIAEQNKVMVDFQNTAFKSLIISIGELRDVTEGMYLKLNAVESLTNALQREIAEVKAHAVGQAWEVKSILVETKGLNDWGLKLNNHMDNTYMLIKKTYWTSRLIDFVVQVYESCRARLSNLFVK